MKLYQGQPDTTTAVLYRADRRIDAYVVVAANVSGADATLTINHGYAGAAAATTNIVVPGIVVAGSHVQVITLPIRLNAGDVLHGVQSSFGAITVTIDGDDGAT